MSALDWRSRKPIKSNGGSNGRSAETGRTSGLSKRDVSHCAPLGSRRTNLDACERVASPRVKGPELYKIQAINSSAGRKVKVSLFWFPIRKLTHLKAACGFCAPRNGGGLQAEAALSQFRRIQQSARQCSIV